MTYINQFDEVGSGDVAVVGGKGAGMGELFRAGLPVPPGFVLNTAAYEAFVEANHLSAAIQELATLAPMAPTRNYENASERIQALFAGGVMPEPIAAELRAAYRRMGNNDGDAAVGVRSSATAEDLASASFAGQQETYLNVSGVRALMEAVTNCWASLWTARAMAYRAREGIGPEAVRLAVIVQQMIDADAAGVMFTANPVNGRRDQIVIGAAWGLGESVVGGSVSTDDVVVDAGTGRVLSRRTADKEVMTVYAGRGTEEVSVPADRRREPVLDDAAAAALAGLGTRIADHFGSPQDIEWVRSGGAFFIVQSRPVTALPEAVADTPTEWPMPYPKGLYFRASIVEQLPDPLSPLFADLIDGSVTRSLTALLTRAVGRNIIRENDIGLPAVNGYAYYYYRTSAMLRMTAKSLSAVRAMIRGDAHMGIAGWREFSHPLYVKALEEWQAKPVKDLTGTELLEGVSALLDAGTVYYTAVQSIIPVATTSEMSFQAFYNKLARRAGDPPAQTFLLGYDSEPIRAEKSLFDLAAWVRELPGLAALLLAAPTSALADSQRSGSPLAGLDPSLGAQWRARFQDHLDRFGHTVYNLDFLNPVPADDPSPLLETLKFYLRGQGNDPHQRQQLLADRREDETRKVIGRLHGLRKAAFVRLLRWAQSAAPIREDALADVGLAWPLIRRMLHELGERLVAAGLIAEAGDVFWLRLQEVRSALEFGFVATSSPEVVIKGAGHPVLASAVEERKMVWRGQRRATPPQMLPESRWMERSLGGMMPARSQEQPGETIKGAGASPGRVSAAACVLTGQQDFDRMQPGAVLVARITTPAWTPLFAMASAVVTDVGGPLSHGSIVAREYGIPAVLGTGVATQRIRSGQDITVDGDAGTVTLGALSPDAPGDASWPPEQ
ncbi:PEP/pyruvate-binding domain-containing protein [Arthrobacter sp. 92]|uniref:PEP/pyruvate-binding domain-containing protein n=1 Tax=Arthrobacter sp. 92 TaxID=3418175 RepID=UPI003D079B05